MLVGETCRYTAAALLAAFGAGNLIGLARIVETPNLRRARLLGGIGGVLSAAALFGLAPGRASVCLATGGIGLLCGVAYVVLVFRHSLHNTTM